ncbi:MAG TPA: hypothetical protein VL485_32215 [Ktedonobacteraceae bacterium]|nr:hypothetical protein [Ktedonobacteraceae bacterium]
MRGDADRHEARSLPLRIGEVTAGATRIGMKPDPYLCASATGFYADRCFPGEWVMRYENC